ncbi:hypothetical protein [Actinoplanes teichomyceticus]|uniref:Lipoprotein n=1 Tax=Actinoplanes teichomyceticus TaxID=1867 RepID=A0A561WLA9_ACTTI|nr:hypothetical protein [Actinoplanes teichomyceticus]TWG24652.1 hypothetical protein FHX34_1021212 [Actinoplanes teichomyceticus]GIF14685.1 hypothetical protein Ate01nite_47170 [Actinoplanes teichomyceticus]
MRRATQLIAALLGGLTAGCGPEPPAAPPTPSPPAASPAPVTAAGEARAAAPDSVSRPPAGDARPLGSGQDIRTADLAARVRVTEEPAGPDQAGDPPYVVRVTVRVLRGTWEFGPALVRLRYAGGSESGPIDGASRPPGAMTLHTGASFTWRVPFEHSAGVGIGAGAQILVIDARGVVLAAWTT